MALEVDTGSVLVQVESGSDGLFVRCPGAL